MSKISRIWPGSRPAAAGAGHGRAGGAGRCDHDQGARHPRAGDDARHARRHQRGELHRRVQLHAGPRQPGQPAQDGQGRPRRRLLHRLRRPGTAEDAFTPAGYDRAYKPAIEKFDAIHRLTEDDRAGQDRPRADVGGRAADLQVGPQGRVHRRRERLPDRRGHQARQGVPRSRRALHVARAQRPQPVVGLQHRRGAGLEVERPLAARQAGDRRDEPRRHHDRHLASRRRNR